MGSTSQIKKEKDENLDEIKYDINEDIKFNKDEEDNKEKITKELKKESIICIKEEKELNEESKLKLKEENENISLINEKIDEISKKFTNNHKLGDLKEILEDLKNLNYYLNLKIKYYKKNKIKKFLDINSSSTSKNKIIKFLFFLGNHLEKYGFNTLIEENSENKEYNNNIFYIINKALNYQTKYEIEFLDKNIINSFKNQKLYSSSNIIKEIKSDLAHILWFNFDIFENQYKFISNSNSQNKTNILSFTVSSGQKRITSLKWKYKINFKCFPLLTTLILSPDIFESEFNRLSNNYSLACNEICPLYRGGEIYSPPYHWLGLALKVKDKFTNNKGDISNSWLGNTGKSYDEWAVGYHGIGKGEVVFKLLKIISEGLKEGKGQLFQDYNDLRKGGKCGRGVYLSSKIKGADLYSEKIYGWNIKIAVMCRVNPKKIRAPEKMPSDWIVNGNYDEVRPYRILIKVEK